MNGKADYTNYTRINEAAAARKGTVILDSDGEDEEAAASDGSTKRMKKAKSSKLGFLQNRSNSRQKSQQAVRRSKLYGNYLKPVFPTEKSEVLSQMSRY